MGGAIAQPTDKTISETLGCDIQEIKDLKDRSGISGFIGGMIDVRKRPITGISPKTVDLGPYDLIFIGTPIWGMKFSPAVNTFITSSDFKNKKVVLFVTTSARMKESAFDEYSEMISQKGGKVVGTFFQKTLGKEHDEIKKEAGKNITDNSARWLN